MERETKAFLIILLTGLPTGLFCFYIRPDEWWIAVSCFILFGIFQYAVFLLFQLIHRKWIKRLMILLSAPSVGMLTASLLIYAVYRIPENEWIKQLSANEKAEKITFATRDFYCLKLTSSEKICCGNIEPYTEQVCVPDIYSANHQENEDSFSTVIDFKNRLLYLPEKPDGVMDVFYVYSYYFEGNAQYVYALTRNGEVWKLTESFTNSETMNIIVAGLVGGMIGLVHSIVQIILCHGKKKNLKEETTLKR